jgi:GAF domain-containing protein
MKTRQPLFVPDALAHEKWNSNPDIELGMTSYLGFPITWPNGDIFGTICVLDNKRNVTTTSVESCFCTAVMCCKQT